MRARMSEGEKDGREVDGVEVVVDVVDMEVEESSLGVLNAPVLCRCNCSNISCSSLGRRGGAGPRSKTEVEGRGVVLKGRDVRVRGERWRRAV